MKFIRIGDEIIRLDLVTHIKEGAKDETLYGRSVRKSTDTRYGWLEVHFVSGELLKIEGEGANILRRILEDEINVQEVAPTLPPRKFTPHEAKAPESTNPEQDRAASPQEEHGPGLRNGFGR